MAKKKKTIVHIKYPNSTGVKSLCGFLPSSLSVIISRQSLKEIGSKLTDFERLCHKCKHIHKLNLAKVK